jgi:hypothetical protein
VSNYGVPIDFWIEYCKRCNQTHDIRQLCPQREQEEYVGRHRAVEE